MKKIFLLLIVNCTLLIVNCFAQVYQINFAGSGASTTVDSVQIQNLTQCKSLSLNGRDTLNLTVTDGIKEISNNIKSSLSIYPNPMTSYCLIDFDAIAQGETTISLYDIAGKRISQVQENLIKENHTFSLNGLGSGMYVLQVKSAQYEYTAKIVSSGLSSGIAEIKHIEAEPSQSIVKSQSSTVAEVKSLKGNKSLINWQYTTGDLLKLNGFSGIYSTVFMLVPDSSQTVTFNFTKCTDGDNNNYPVVQIGTQIWMEENLKTTKYNDGTAIPLVTDNTAWTQLSTPGYCWYNDSAVKYKNSYGGLYNWFAVNTGKLCPTNWHVPDTTEWSTLINYLGGYNIAGGKMKEVCSNIWDSPNTGATNYSGLTFLSSGYRIYTDGSFVHMGDGGFWWLTMNYGAELGWYCFLSYLYPNAYLLYNIKQDGFSVRCIKN